MSNIEEVKSRKGRTIAIATEGDTEIAKKVNHVLYVPETNSLLTPILMVIPYSSLPTMWRSLRVPMLTSPEILQKASR